MTKIFKNNDHNLRQQLSEALTALEARATALEAGASTYAYVSADQTAIGTAFADVTGTGFAVAANTSYEFEFHIIADSDAATTGIDVACNGPASPTSIRYTQVYWNSVTAVSEANASSYDSNTVSTGSAGTRPAIYTVIGVLINGANAGTLIARIKREAVGTGPNVRPGSFGRIRKLA